MNRIRTTRAEQFTLTKKPHLAEQKKAFPLRRYVSRQFEERKHKSGKKLGEKFCSVVIPLQILYIIDKLEEWNERKNERKRKHPLSRMFA